MSHDKEQGQPLVSVIVALYNGEAFLSRCLQCLLAQTCADFELILCVSLGSTDRSVELCEMYAARDARVRVVARHDKGLGDARNYGLHAARGRYIAFVDVDDTVEPEFLATLVQPLEETTADIAICGFDRTWQDGTVKPGWLPPETGLVTTDFASYYAKTWYGVVWNKMYRRSWLEQHELQQPVGNHEDDGWHMMLAALVQQVYFLPCVLYHYNQDNAQSLMQHPEGRLQYFQSMGVAIDYLARHGLLESNRVAVRRVLRDRQRKFDLDFPQDVRFDAAARTLYEQYFPEEIAWQEVELAALRREPGRGAVVLFGAGADGRRLLRQLGRERVLAFVDNNAAVQGQKVENVPVLSLEDCLMDHPEAEILVASSKYREPICQQLLTAGCRQFIMPEVYFLRERFRLSRQHIVLLNTPCHGNVGDHAIAVQERRFIQQFFPYREIVEIDENECLYLRWHIKELVETQDIIVITGGGFLGSLWVRKGEQALRNAIQDFSHNLLVVFPQTLYFEDSTYGRQERTISERYYRAAKHLVLFLRERGSYERACTLLGRAESCHLVPDIVLSWQVPAARAAVSSGRAALCLKSNQESRQSTAAKVMARNALTAQGWQVEDISMVTGAQVTYANRMLLLQRQIQLLRQYEVVVTDALHAMIFCAVAGVPCVALDNISRKLSGVYAWIEDLPYIAFAASAADVAAQVAVVRGQQCAYTFDYAPYAQKIAEVIQTAWLDLQAEAKGVANVSER